MPAGTADRTASVDWDLWSTHARLVVSDPDALDAGRDACERTLAEIDRAANRFDQDSELSRLADDGRPVTVSPLLADLVAEALSVAAMTGGLVDPTVGGTLTDLGYDRDIRLVRDHGGHRRAQVRRVRGWRTVDLEGTTLRLRPGVRLDLGATAKASAADRCARAVVAATGGGALVSLGGDLASAGRGPRGGWQIEVRDLARDLPAKISLPDSRAVATSSSRRRTWLQDGVPHHHLVDPRTSRPAADTWAAVSVVAGTCLVANAASTAAMVLGRADLDWLARTGLPARVLDHDGTVHRLNGWPASS